MNIPSLPTQHQISVIGTHVAAAAGSVIAVVGYTHIADATQVADATAAVGKISDGVSLIMQGGGTLILIGTTIFATIRSGPFASLLRSVTAIAQDPAKLAQVKTGDTGATLDQKAALLLVTDKLPEVAGIATVRTDVGKALADAVPSETVQPTTTPTFNNKAS